MDPQPSKGVGKRAAADEDQLLPKAKIQKEKTPPPCNCNFQFITILRIEFIFAFWIFFGNLHFRMNSKARANRNIFLYLFHKIVHKTIPTFVRFDKTIYHLQQN